MRVIFPYASDKRSYEHALVADDEDVDRTLDLRLGKPSTLAHAAEASKTTPRHLLNACTIVNTMTESMGDASAIVIIAINNNTRFTVRTNRWLVANSRNTQCCILLRDFKYTVKKGSMAVKGCLCTLDKMGHVLRSAKGCWWDSTEIIEAFKELPARVGIR